MMTDSAFRLPIPCPKCLAFGGRPCRAESKTSQLVIVAMRCAECGHEWTAERVTPFLVPPDRRTRPEELA